MSDKFLTSAQLKQLVEKCGSNAALARKVGCSPRLVRGWGEGKSSLKGSKFRQVVNVIWDEVMVAEDPQEFEGVSLEQLSALKDKYGSVPKLAKALNLAPSGVYSWFQGAKPGKKTGLLLKQLMGSLDTVEVASVPAKSTRQRSASVMATVVHEDMTDFYITRQSDLEKAWVRAWVDHISTRTEVPAATVQRVVATFIALSKDKISDPEVLCRYLVPGA